MSISKWIDNKLNYIFIDLYNIKIKMTYKPIKIIIS